MSQSKAPYSDHGGKKRKPTARNLAYLENTHAQAKADRDALRTRTRAMLATRRAGAATSESGAR
ncbi:hypothetical protein [Cellulomonas endometrii]|uniref:hypothetical protein n=1 Tax=Cellulomonas endometrii TaxID=3036301 RepID=UPI0024AD6083|nr:hypothetical protein [Cellulomonas endometrii]